MAFLRVKRVRERSYVYLVENVWHAPAGQSRQHVLRYLGRIDRVRPEQLPDAHRTPGILRELAELKAVARRNMLTEADRHRARLTEVLLRGDPAGASAVARAALRALGESEFLHRVLAGSMREVGRCWSQGTATISQEHGATSIVTDLLTRLHARRPTLAPGGPEVVVCVPEGESHTLPLLLAERPLLEKGYRVVNIGPSAPSDSTVEFIRARRPYGVLVSVTQPACLEAAAALARRIRLIFPGTRIAVGGQAVERSPQRSSIRGVDLWQGSMGEYLDSWPGSGRRT